MVTSPSRHLLPSWQFKVRRSFIVHKTFQELHSKTAFPKMANGISSDFFKMNWLEIGSQRSKVRVTLTSQNMFVAITQFYAQMSNKISGQRLNDLWCQSLFSPLLFYTMTHHDREEVILVIKESCLDSVSCLLFQMKETRKYSHLKSRNLVKFRLFFFLKKLIQTCLSIIEIVYNQIHLLFPDLFLTFTSVV